MRLEQLQAFLAIADTGGFQAAAKRCGVTQSTISRQLQSLESTLGLSLIRRSTPIQLTLAGNQLLPHARRMVQEWDLASRAIANLREGQQPELCIAAIHSVCAYRLPAILQDFIQTYPQVQLRVTALGSDRSLKVLRDGLVDVAVVMNNRFLTNNADWVVDSLYKEPVVALVSASHPLANHGPVSWLDLGEYPHVVFKDGYGMQRLVQEQFAREGITLRVALELNTLDAFRGVVRQGKCVALLPESAVLEAKEDPGLRVLPLADPAIEREVVLVTTRDRLQLQPISYFRQLVQATLHQQALLPNHPLAK